MFGFLRNKKEEWLVAFLGNPGDSYNGTRHNISRELISSHINLLSKDKFFDGEKGEFEYGGDNFIFLVPNSFMNLSGHPIKKALKIKNIKPDHLIIVYDDLGISSGKYKLSFGIGDGGHNGVVSTVDALGTKDFFHLRIGIRPQSEEEYLQRASGPKKANFVLGKLTDEEKSSLAKIKKDLEPLLTMIAKEGTAKAMSIFNFQG